MKTLKCLAGLTLLALAVGCPGTPTVTPKEKDKASLGGLVMDPGKMMADQIAAKKDEIVASLTKQLPGAAEVIELLKKKLTETKGDGKTVIEELIAKLGAIVKTLTEKLEVLKKTTDTTELKDKVVDVSKDSGTLTELLAKAKELLGTK